MKAASPNVRLGSTYFLVVWALLLPPECLCWTKFPVLSLEPDVPATTVLTWKDAWPSLVELMESTCTIDRLCGRPKDEDQTFCRSCDLCYCDDLCVQLGDCCVDKQLDFLGNQPLNATHRSFVKPSAECVDTRFKDTRQKVLRTTHQQRMITLCPSGYQDSAVLAACEDSGTLSDNVTSHMKTVRQLFANWPVASPTTLISYKNKACAVCNGEGEDTLVEWHVEVGCGELGDISKSTNRTVLLDHVVRSPRCGGVALRVPSGFSQRQCHVLTGPSKFDMDFGRFSTFEKLLGVEAASDSIASCNVSGERTRPDAVLWKACETFSGTVNAKTYPSYINLYCLSCQTDPWQDPRTACRSGVGFPFMVVFDPKALQDYKQGKLTADLCECASGQVYDTDKGQCRPLICPPYKTLRDGECRRTLVTSQGLPYVLDLKLRASTTPSVQALAELEALYPLTERSASLMALSLKDQLMKKLFREEALLSTLRKFVVYGFKTDLNSSAEMDIFLHVLLEVKSEMTSELLESRLQECANATDWSVQVDGLVMAAHSEYAPAPDAKIADLSRGVGASVGTYEVEKDGVFRTLITYVVDLADPEMEEMRLYFEVKNTLTCPQIAYNLSENGDFTLTENYTGFAVERKLFHSKSGLVVSFPDFNVFDAGSIVVVCADKLAKYFSESHDKNDDDGDDERDEVYSIEMFGTDIVVLSYICLGLSTLTHSATLLTYALFPSLRSIPGKCIMGVVATQLGSIVIFLLNGYVENSDTTLCQLTGIINHFLLMASFTWMAICTYHMYFVFAHTLEVKPLIESGTRMAMYYAIGFIVPTTIVTMTILGNYAYSELGGDSSSSSSDSEGHSSASLGSLDEYLAEGLAVYPLICEFPKTVTGYGEGICYISNTLSILLAETLPIGLGCFINLGLFTITVISFRKMAAQERLLRKETRNSMKICVRLSTLTGLNWLPAMVSAFISSRIVWCIFLVLCGLQGVYVFWAFVLNRRVLALYSRLCCGRHPYEPSPGNTARDKEQSGTRSDSASGSRVQEVKQGGQPSASTTVSSVASKDSKDHDAKCLNARVETT